MHRIFNEVQLKFKILGAANFVREKYIHKILCQQTCVIMVTIFVNI